jgi:hypothetical protein
MASRLEAAHPNGRRRPVRGVYFEHDCPDAEERLPLDDAADVVRPLASVSLSGLPVGLTGRPEFAVAALLLAPTLFDSGLLGFAVTAG